MVAMMLTYQPFYIGGIEDIEQAKKNVYGGVGTFLSIFILSVVYLVLDALSIGEKHCKLKYAIGCFIIQ